MITNVVACTDLQCKIGFKALILSASNIIYNPKHFSGAMWRNKKIGGLCMVFSNSKLMVNGKAKSVKECKRRVRKYTRLLYDVTSLYPFVNKTGKIPLGHPEIITEKFDSIDNNEGLIKCKILPPKELYIPVLPARCNGKLMFSLCRSCSEAYLTTKCKHFDEERAFTGTWVTDEVKKHCPFGTSS